ncbi:chaplin [Actinomadura sp. NAK00032]|uniref:chaplin n=1 Tax=Actinomadura sp. NAK00032 TaxID=2742128 RepID=UPI0015917E9F|nr:chaplin [Actinomadura sp. NAK00032]QKW33203.1 chaplin [Actinomadura sp. NAK00032]
MRTRAKGTSRAAVLAAGFVALGVTVLPANAFADVTSGDGGVLSGNQIDAPISAPVDVSGNNAAVLGIGDATSHGGAKVHQRRADGQRTSGAHGVASGNQLNAPISAPVNVCGNSVAVVGVSDAGCEGGAKVIGGGRGGQNTDGSGSVLGGNQLNAPISAPVNVCGNAVAVVGNAVAGCEGGAHVKNGGHAGSGQETSGVFGVGSGNQGNVPISAPVDVCGNAVGTLVGNAAASCAGGASVHDGGHYGSGHQITGGAFGVLSGNQADSPISVPVNVCGNAAAVVGHAWAFCEGGAQVTEVGGGHQHTSGVGGVLAGNQAHAPTKAPVDVCGNTAALVGIASARCQDGDGYPTYPTYPDYPTYPGNPGYDDYSSSPRVLDLLPQTGLPGVASGLPSVTDLPRPVNVPVSNSRAQNGGVPSPTVPSVNNLLKPGEVPQVPGRPVADGRRAKGGIPGTDGLPAANGLVKTGAVQGGLPDLEGVVRSGGLNELLNLRPAAGTRQAGVPVADALSLGTPGRPMPGGGLPGTGLSKMVKPVGERADVARPGLLGFVLGKDPLAAVNGIVTVDPLTLPAGQSGAVQQRDAAAQPLPLPGGLVKGQEVPVAVSALDTRALPGTGNPLPTTENPPPTTGNPLMDAVDGGVKELGPVRNVAADGPIVEDGAGSLWALGASAVLGAVAGVLALARRLLPGGRR